MSKFASHGDDVAGTVKKFGKGSKAKAVGRGAARSSGLVFKKDGAAWKSLEELMKKNDKVNYRKISESSHHSAVLKRDESGSYPRRVTRDK